MLERLAKFQNADGGWWGIGMLKAPLSTISNTINGLHWLRMVGAEKSALLDRTVAFLKAGQKEGGYWDEPKEILDHDPLMWMVPGKRANQVWYGTRPRCAVTCWRAAARTKWILRQP